jgi:hypothetical protein
MKSIFPGRTLHFQIHRHRTTLYLVIVITENLHDPEGNPIELRELEGRDTPR